MQWSTSVTIGPKNADFAHKYESLLVIRKTGRGGVLIERKGGVVVEIQLSVLKQFIIISIVNVQQFHYCSLESWYDRERQ